MAVADVEELALLFIAQGLVAALAYLVQYAVHFFLVLALSLAVVHVLPELSSARHMHLGALHPLLEFAEPLAHSAALTAVVMPALVIPVAVVVASSASVAPIKQQEQTEEHAAQVGKMGHAIVGRPETRAVR